MVVLSPPATETIRCAHIYPTIVIFGFYTETLDHKAAPFAGGRRMGKKKQTIG